MNAAAGEHEPQPPHHGGDGDGGGGDGGGGDGGGDAPASTERTAPALGAPLPAHGTRAEVGELVRWTTNLLLRTCWTGARLRQDFCTRSPRDLLERPEIAFTAPCVDLSGLVAALLAESGLRPTLVLAGIRRPLQTIKFQAGVEVVLEGARWVIGFGVSSTYFYEGRFVETARRPLVLRVRPERLDWDTPLLCWFEPGGRATIDRRIEGYRLEDDLRLHTRKNHRLGHWLARRTATRAKRAQRAGRLPDAPGRWG